MSGFMPRFVPPPLIALIFLPCIIFNTLLFAALILMCTPLRFFMPTRHLRESITALLIRLANTWNNINNHVLLRLLPRIDWDIQIPDNLSVKNWYFVIANHQSWVDILVLFHVFNQRIPFLKYFLKQELIWVPLIGQALYVMDFPFMKRYSKETLARHPELKGKDAETTRRSCEKFRYTPVSVVNFLEGTRFTPVKQDQQQSPYRYLLKPKAGGVAFALSVLGEQMSSLLDTTIVYPDGIPSFVDFAGGHVRRVIVRVRQRDIPAQAFSHNYETDAGFHADFQNWIARLWEEKDSAISQLLGQEKAQ